MSDLGTIVDPHTIRFVRDLLGPIGLVWDHLTKPELLVTWLARGEFDPRVGGSSSCASTSMRSPNVRLRVRYPRGVTV